MAQYIDKSALVAEIEKLEDEAKIHPSDFGCGRLSICKELMNFIDTFEEKEVDLIDRKTDWSPSEKQMESLKDMLKYNIGVFDYQKFMEVKSLYDDLTKILDYETDRQK